MATLTVNAFMIAIPVALLIRPLHTIIQCAIGTLVAIILANHPAKTRDVGLVFQAMLIAQLIAQLVRHNVHVRFHLSVCLVKILALVKTTGAYS